MVLMRDNKGRILPNKEEEVQPVVAQPQTAQVENKDKFEAFHQPEVVGIRDIDTDEVIILRQASNLTDFVGDAVFKARELTLLDKTAKSVA